MTLDTFFEKFELLADAPNAVAKMRDLVLEFAAQGRLCEQDSGEISPEETLKKVVEEKEALHKRGLLRRLDKPDTILESWDSSPVPAHWKLVPLSALCIAVTDGDHLPPPKTESGVPFLVISDVRWGSIDFEGCRYVSEDYYGKLDWIRKPKKDDILYTLVGSYGIPVVVRDEQRFCVQRHIGVIRPSSHVILNYLAHVLASRFVYQQAAAVATGIAQKTVPLAGLRRIVIPLPPLAEQKRIVAKVDELMALCDRLEAQQQERSTRHAALARASLSRFAEAPTPANLNLLFHKSYDIAPADLRKAILTLAVQGKLVKQDPREGKTTMVTMEELVGRKNLKNGLSLSPTADPTEFVCLPLSAMSGSNLDCSFGKPIAITPERAAPYLIEPGDIFIMRGNGSKERVGIAAMARTTPPNVLFPDLLIRIPLPHEKIDGEFFLIAWNNPLTRKTVEALAATTAGIWKINQGQISECSIPLPPLTEQRRIVAKVDELMALVDALETQLAASRESAGKLLEATVAELSSRTNNPKEGA